MTDRLALVKALRTAMSAHAPGWTDTNDSDPGITLLQVMAYLGEDLLNYRGAVQGGATAAFRVIDALDVYDDEEIVAVCVNGRRWHRVERLAEAKPGAEVFTLDEATGTIAFGDGTHGRVPESGDRISARYRRGDGSGTSVTLRTVWPLTGIAYQVSLRGRGTIQMEACVALAESWSGTKRPNYFSGKLLTADDLQQEQSYGIEKHRRHLRSLHGSGIVHGLQVSANEQRVTVEPGLAIDSLGREIQLKESVTAVIPSDTSSPALVAVEYTERGVDPVVQGDATESSRIEEGCKVVLSDGPCEGVVVARLIKDGSAWRTVDFDGGITILHT